MSARLRVAFGEPEHGWLPVELEAGGGSVRFQASYVYDSLACLVDALSILVSSPGDRTVVWLAEPAEYEMRFLRAADGVRFSLWAFRGSQRAASDGAQMMSFDGTYSQVCLPFWRGLRTLHGASGEERIAMGWQRSFPAGRIEEWTRELKGAGLIR